MLKHTRPHCSCTTCTQDGSIAPKLPRVTTHERVQPENEPSSSTKIKWEKVKILQKCLHNNSQGKQNVLKFRITIRILIIATTERKLLEHLHTKKWKSYFNFFQLCGIKVHSEDKSYFSDGCRAMMLPGIVWTTAGCSTQSGVKGDIVKQIRELKKKKFKEKAATVKRFKLRHHFYDAGEKQTMLQKYSRKLLTCI